MRSPGRRSARDLCTPRLAPDGSQSSRPIGGKLPPQSCGNDVAQDGPSRARQKPGPATKQSLVMAGPAVLFCACVACAVWARLSGAARLGNAAGHGGPTKRQHDETPC